MDCHHCAILGSMKSWQGKTNSLVITFTMKYTIDIYIYIIELNYEDRPWNNFCQSDVLTGIKTSNLALNHSAPKSVWSEITMIFQPLWLQINLILKYLVFCWNLQELGLNLSWPCSWVLLGNMQFFIWGLIFLNIFYWLDFFLWPFLMILNLDRFWNKYLLLVKV